MNLLEFTHFQHTSIIISSEDTLYGLRVVTSRYMDLPRMMVTITWLLVDSFTIVILDMDFALYVDYFDVVPCGAFVDINNYPMDGLATISNSMSLLRNLNYKQTHQMTPIWNGFHMIVLIGNVDIT